MTLQVLVGAATILPTGLVAAVHGVGIPETWKPGQAEACPHTATMTQHGRHKKSASCGAGARSACAKFTNGFLRPVTEFSATGKFSLTYLDYTSGKVVGNVSE